MSTRSPAFAALLGLCILALGFVSGLGYQSLQHAQENQKGNDVSTPAKPPVVKNLRVSPDGRLMAFTAIYNDASDAGRFVFDLKTFKWSEKKTPRGWQDSVAQWSRDGRAILFEREKIPRAADDAQAGLHEENIAVKKETLQRDKPQFLIGALKNGDKVVAGFWTPDGKLIVKARHESKALWAQSEAAKILDRSPGTYYQNRAVRENGVTVFYVVRDVSIANKTVGLFRIENGKARRIGSTLSDVTWAYLADNARRLLLCRVAQNGRDWRWSLYAVSPNSLKLQKQNDVPRDVIAVYWSPDYQTVLGAAGKSLWLISMPDLRVQKLGARDDWNADDAAWLPHENAVIVAAQGHFWKVNTHDGARREVWKFPDKYWNED